MELEETFISWRNRKQKALGRGSGKEGEKEDRVRKGQESVLA